MARGKAWKEQLHKRGFQGRFVEKGLSARSLREKHKVEIKGLGAAKPRYKVVKHDTGGPKELGQVVRGMENGREVFHIETAHGRHPDGPFPTRAMAGAAVADMHNLISDTPVTKKAAPIKAAPRAKDRAMARKSPAAQAALAQGKAVDAEVQGRAKRAKGAEAASRAEKAGQAAQAARKPSVPGDADAIRQELRRLDMEIANLGKFPQLQRKKQQEKMELQRELHFAVEDEKAAQLKEGAVKAKGAAKPLSGVGGEGLKGRKGRKGQAKGYGKDFIGSGPQAKGGVELLEGAKAANKAHKGGMQKAANAAKMGKPVKVPLSEAEQKINGTQQIKARYEYGDLVIEKVKHYERVMNGAHQVGLRGDITQWRVRPKGGAQKELPRPHGGWGHTIKEVLAKLAEGGGGRGR